MSAFISIGRYEKKSIGLPLSTPMSKILDYVSKFIQFNFANCKISGMRKGDDQENTINIYLV